jgi:hypothetical protein
LVLTAFSSVRKGNTLLLVDPRVQAPRRALRRVELAAAGDNRQRVAAA